MLLLVLLLLLPGNIGCIHSDTARHSRAQLVQWWWWWWWKMCRHQAGEGGQDPSSFLLSLLLLPSIAIGLCKKHPVHFDVSALCAYVHCCCCCNCNCIFCSEMLPPDWEIVSRSFDFRPPTIGAMNIGSIGGVTPSQVSHRGRRRALVDDRFSSHRTQHTAQCAMRAQNSQCPSFCVAGYCVVSTKSSFGKLYCTENAATRQHSLDNNGGGYRAGRQGTELWR